MSYGNIALLTGLCIVARVVLGWRALAPSTPLRSVLGASGGEERVSCHSGWTTTWRPIT